MTALSDLVGMHTLDAVGESIGGGMGDDAAEARIFYVRLDGIVYRFAEDTSDGYRSCLGDIATVEPPECLALVHPPMVVEARLHPIPHNNDVVYFVNERTGLVVLELGTTNTDDYYPSFISHWVPEGHTPEWLRDATESTE